jgi:hypothetical protein
MYLIHFEVWIFLIHEWYHYFSRMYKGRQVNFNGLLLFFVLTHKSVIRADIVRRLFLCNTLPMNTIKSIIEDESFFLINQNLEKIQFFIKTCFCIHIYVLNIYMLKPLYREQHREHRKAFTIRRCSL